MSIRWIIDGSSFFYAFASSMTKVLYGVQATMIHSGWNRLAMISYKNILMFKRMITWFEQIGLYSRLFGTAFFVIS